MGTTTPIYDIPEKHPADLEAERAALEAQRIARETITLDDLRASLENEETLGAAAQKASKYTKDEGVRDKTSDSYSSGSAIRCDDRTTRIEDFDFFGNVEKYSFDALATNSFQLRSITVKSGQVKYEKKEKVFCADTPNESRSYELGKMTFSFLALDRIGEWRSGSVTVNGDRNEIWDGIEFYVQTPLFRRSAIGFEMAVRSIRTLLGLSNDRLADFSEN